MINEKSNTSLPQPPKGPRIPEPLVTKAGDTIEKKQEEPEFTLTPQYDEQYNSLEDLKLFTLDKPPLKIKYETVGVGDVDFHGIGKARLFDENNKKIIYNGPNAVVIETTLGKLMLKVDSTTSQRLYCYASRAPENWTPELIWYRETSYGKELFLPEEFKYLDLLLPNNCSPLSDRNQYGIFCAGPLPTSLKLIPPEERDNYLKIKPDQFPLYYRKIRIEPALDKINIIPLEDFIKFIKTHFTTRFVGRNQEIERDPYMNPKALLVPFTTSDSKWFDSDSYVVHKTEMFYSRNSKLIYPAKYYSSEGVETGVKMVVCTDDERRESPIDGYEYDLIYKLGFTKEDFVNKVKQMNQRSPDEKKYFETYRFREFLSSIDSSGHLNDSLSNLQKEYSYKEFECDKSDLGKALTFRAFQKWYISKFITKAKYREDTDTIYTELAHNGYFKTNRSLLPVYPSEAFTAALKDLFNSFIEKIPMKQNLVRLKKKIDDFRNTIEGKYFWIGQTPFSIPD